MSNKKNIKSLEKKIKSLEVELELHKKDFDFLTKHPEVTITNYYYNTSRNKNFRYYCKSNSPQFREFIFNRFQNFDSFIIDYSFIDGEYVLNGVQTIYDLIGYKNRNGSICIKNYESFDKKIKDNIDKIIKKIIIKYGIVKINKKSYKYEYFNNFAQNLIFA